MMVGKLLTIFCVSGALPMAALSTHCSKRGRDGHSRSTDQTRSNKAVQRRIPLGGPVCPHHEEHLIRVPGPALATRRRQQRVHILPDFGFELCDLLRREAPCTLTVEGRCHLAVGELPDKDLNGIRKRGEDMRTHRVVILLPAFVVLTVNATVSLLLSRPLNVEIARQGRKKGS